MKKAYLYNNYVVIEDGINVYLFNIYNSFTVVNSNDYTIQSSVGNRAVILIADAPNWYDETGTIPFDADSLLLFLETYTGQFQKAENGIPEGGTTGQILAKIDGTDYNAEWIDNYANWTSQLKHEVKAGEPLIKGQAVYVSSADGTNMIVSKASNISESTSSKTMGLIAESLATNGKGYLITEGLLAGLNTSTANAGDPVWLGTNGNLIFGLTNKPSAPAHLVFIGIVTRSNNSNGEIFVKVQNGFEFQELHNVAITSPANKNTIFFNSSNSLWENRLIAIDDVSSLQSALNSKENTSNKGIANGYASLGGDGKVPSTQLPSYVDDVIEVANYASLPSVGETGVIYITLDNNNVYRWTGSTYVQISQPNAIWGSITGTLSDQTDLQSALNAKQDAATAINTSNIGSQSVAYATNAGNSDTLDGYHASAFQMALTNPVTGTGILNYVAKFGSSSTIENSQIYDNGFQVGVGLTNPSSRFHVNGLSILTNPSGDNYNENLRLPQTSNGYSSIAMGGPVATLGTSVQQWTLVKHPTNNFSIRHYNTDHLFINTDGNFGLGTTSPDFKLDVNGIINTSVFYRITNGSTLIGAIGSESGIFGAGGNDWIFYNGNATSNVFYTSGVERMRITHEGRIGIGNTNPETRLHLNGNITVPFTHTYNVEGSYTRKAIFYTGWNNNGDSKDFLIIQAAGNSDSKVCFPSGNVAIGSNDPRYKLSVQDGEISINNLPDGYATPMGVIGAFNNDAQNCVLIFKTATGNSLTEKMRITSAGNVGIGTSDPLQKLHVYGNIHMDGSQLRFPSGVNVLTLANVSGSWNSLQSQGINIGDWYSNPAYGDILVGDYNFDVIRTDGTHIFRVLNNGNVGIGTTNPAKKLHVTSSASYGTVNDQIILEASLAGGSATNPAYYGGITFNSYGYEWGAIRTIQANPAASWQNRLAFFTMNGAGGTTAIERMSIDNNGNVGIGTTVPDPSAILDVTSSTQGFLPPRMDNSEINSISNPAEGLIVYSTQSKCLFLFDGASWQKIAFA